MRQIALERARVRIGAAAAVWRAVRHGGQFVLQFAYTAAVKERQRQNQHHHEHGEAEADNQAGVVGFDHLAAGAVQCGVRRVHRQHLTLRPVVIVQADTAAQFRGAEELQVGGAAVFEALTVAVVEDAAHAAVRAGCIAPAEFAGAGAVDRMTAVEKEKYQIRINDLKFMGANFNWLFDWFVKFWCMEHGVVKMK